MTPYSAFALLVVLAASRSSCLDIFKNCKIDLGIVLDESSSLGRDGFLIEKNFVKNLTSTFVVGNDGIHISLLRFSSRAEMDIFFNNASAQSKSLFDAEIDSIRIRGGLTRTHLALDLARTTMFTAASGQRENVPKILIVITDGRSQSGTSGVALAAEKIKRTSINILSIGIGKLINSDELHLISSGPQSDHVFLVPDIKNLLEIVGNVRRESCREINCPYKTCVHSEWTAWAGTCDKAERVRKLESQTDHNKLQIGGCAGLSNTCEPEIRETKVLENKCLKDCTVFACTWTDWSAWTPACGNSSRVTQLSRYTINEKALDCQKLQNEKGCNELVEMKKEQRSTKCQCPSVDCQQSPWSPWTSSCGPATRTRRFAPVPIVVEAYSCEGVVTHCSTVVQADQRFVPCLEGPLGIDNTRCPVTFGSLGCFKDDLVVPRPLPELILNERDKDHKNWNGILIDWESWDTYYPEFLCRCAAKARDRGFSYFSAQFYGECWSGPKAGQTYSRNGISTECIKGGFEKCNTQDQKCVGTAHANFVYAIEN